MDQKLIDGINNQIKELFELVEDNTKTETVEITSLRQLINDFRYNLSLLMDEKIDKHQLKCRDTLVHINTELEELNGEITKSIHSISERIETYRSQIREDFINHITMMQERVQKKAQELEIKIDKKAEVFAEKITETERLMDVKIDKNKEAAKIYTDEQLKIYNNSFNSRLQDAVSLMKEFFVRESGRSNIVEAVFYGMVISFSILWILDRLLGIGLISLIKILTGNS